MVNDGVSAGFVDVSLYAAQAGVHEIGSSVNHRLSIHVGAPIRAACRCDGRSSRRLQRHGDIDIIPAALPGVWEDEQACTLLRLGLMPALIDAAAEGLGLNRAIVELTPRFQLDDPQIRHIGWALKAELESGYPGGRLFVESSVWGSQRISSAATLLGRLAPSSNGSAAFHSKI
jgi:AraC family transcriptional regulator